MPTRVLYFRVEVHGETEHQLARAEHFAQSNVARAVDQIDGPAVMTAYDSAGRRTKLVAQKGAPVPELEDDIFDQLNNDIPDAA